MSREKLAPINVEWQVKSQVNTSPSFPLCDSSGSKTIGVTPGKQFAFFKTSLLKSIDPEAGHSVQLQFAHGSTVG